MSLDWYPWYPKAFHKKTLHLTLAQDGAYRRLIDEYMLSRQPLPDDDLALSRILAVTPAEWKSVGATVRAFFVAQGGFLLHERCEEEIGKQERRTSARAAINKRAATERWRDHNENKRLNASRMHRACTEHAPSNASSMHANATLSKKEEKEEPSEPASRDSVANSPPGSLATALLVGARASPALSEQDIPRKPIAHMTAAEVMAMRANGAKEVHVTKVEMPEVEFTIGARGVLS